MTDKQTGGQDKNNMPPELKYRGIIKIIQYPMKIFVIRKSARLFSV